MLPLKRKLSKYSCDEHFWYRFISFDCGNGILDVVVSAWFYPSILDHHRYL
jgi:hypothetical protein